VPPENGNIILSQNDKPLTGPLRNGLLFLYELVDKISHKNFFSPASFDVSIDILACKAAAAILGGRLSNERVATRKPRLREDLNGINTNRRQRWMPLAKWTYRI
jgi:hypothetical protein